MLSTISWKQWEWWVGELTGIGFILLVCVESVCCGTMQLNLYIIKWRLDVKNGWLYLLSSLWFYLHEYVLLWWCQETWLHAIPVWHYFVSIGVGNKAKSLNIEVFEMSLICLYRPSAIHYKANPQTSATNVLERRCNLAIIGPTSYGSMAPHCLDVHAEL